MCVLQDTSKSIPTKECVVSHGAEDPGEDAGNYAGSRLSTRSHHSTTASQASRYTNHTQDYTPCTGVVQDGKIKHVLYSECMGAAVCTRMLSTIKEAVCFAVHA